MPLEHAFPQKAVLILVVVVVADGDGVVVLVVVLVVVGFVVNKASVDEMLNRRMDKAILSLIVE